MESNNIITAPQVDGVEELFPKWKQNHIGTVNTFYEFMTTPSAEREEFIISVTAECKFANGVAEVVLRKTDDQ